MVQQRQQARVPINGQAILSNDQGICIAAATKDISRDSIGLEKPTDSLAEPEYQIRISTDTGQQIHLHATLIHSSIHTTGFKTSEIDEHDLLKQTYIDEDGNEVSVTFDIK